MSRLDAEEQRRYDELAAEGASPLLDPVIVQLTQQRKTLKDTWDFRQAKAEALRAAGETLRARSALCAQGFASLLSEENNVSFPISAHPVLVAWPPYFFTSRSIQFTSSLGTPSLHMHIQF